MQLMLTLLCTYDSSDILDLQIFDKFNHQRFSFESIMEFFSHSLSSSVYSTI